MLRSAKELLGYRLLASDGKIGSIYDLHFDDRTSTIRYCVADTGNWLSGRLVLLSPVSFGSPEWRDRTIPVNLTKRQIEASPDIDSDQTVSRKHELEIGHYYGWPPYWAAALPPEGPGYVAVATAEPDVQVDTVEPHLRSIREVLGYHIQAIDGEIGHVEDFVFQDDNWVIRYMAVDTRNWLPGRKVLVSPLWINAIHWKERKVEVNLMRESIREAPAYDPSEPVNREYEVRLFDYYGRPKYW